MLCVLVLAAWTAPGAGAFAIGVHLSLHHAAPHDEPSDRVSDLLDAATHGHHHGTEASPAHDHDATLAYAAPAQGPSGGSAAVLPPGGSLRAPDRRAACHDRPPRWGPTAPLFTKHCALLL
ncbi:MAG: hypothetical protein ACLF0P_08050 [Thermoanaerobaculia bacterium]